MHPIERLRHVARAEGADPALVAREAAHALGAVARSEPAGLLLACRRLVARHVASGPVWWLAARMLCAVEPVEAARQAAAELEDDPTERALAMALPDDATVVVVGWPDVTAAALRRRGDIEALIAEGGGDGAHLARRLADAGGEVTLLPDRGLGAAAVVADVVLVEALAAGPSGLLAVAGSHAAAAVAVRSGVAVWGIVPVGRVLPERLWQALLERFDARGEPWERDAELVPAALLEQVCGPDGLVGVEEGLAAATCQAASELFRDAG
jgi:hypothetical protein